MGYKVLGYVIWHGLTWYVRRHAREAGGGLRKARRLAHQRPDRREVPAAPGADEHPSQTPGARQP